MAGFTDRLKAAFNILVGETPELPRESMIYSINTGVAYGIWRDTYSAVLSPILNRISVDASSVDIRHVILDENGSYIKTKESELNDRLTLSANIDQTGRVFIQDAVTTMLRHGHCVLVPIDTSFSPSNTSSYDILSIRVGVVTQWFNKTVEVEVYNEIIGDRSTIILPKSYVAVCYNPFYDVMNAENSTLKRLVNKLALLDVTDSKSNGPNLDLILQLPYAVKTPKREAEAERRLKTFTNQLYDKRYGVAYADATERITQLNRPVANNLFPQVEALTKMLYSQLGLTEPVFLGDASPEQMVAYFNRTISPLLTEIVESARRSFLTMTAIRQGQSIMFFPPVFKFSSLEVVADASDKFTRNEIMSTNEVRSKIGLNRVDTPEADELRNKNLNKPTEDNNNNNNNNLPQEGGSDEESETKA